MLDIRPITDLRNTTEISEACHANNGPIFITKNGYSDLVIMSTETYESLLENGRIDRAIAEAEREFQANRLLLPAHEVFAELRGERLGSVQNSAV